MRISDWSSDVCSSDLAAARVVADAEHAHLAGRVGLCDEAADLRRADVQRGYQSVLRQVRLLLVPGSLFRVAFMSGGPPPRRPASGAPPGGRGCADPRSG